MIVQAKCPGCQNMLRIPADWVDKPIRCKHCGMVIQAQRKSTSAAAPAPARAATDKTEPIAAPVIAPKKTQPAVAAPMPSAPVSTEPESADSFEQLPHVAAVRRSAVRSKNKTLSIGLIAAGLVAVAGTIYGVIQLTGQSGSSKSDVAKANSKGEDAKAPTADPPAGGRPEDKNKSNTGKNTTDSSKSGSDLPVSTKPFPRRMLAISVSNYLYFNPISYGGDKNSNTSALLSRLAKSLHFPQNQIVELSDGAAGASARPPMKSVIEKTITDFVDSSRPQDRIVLLFTGHAVEQDDIPYLVPLEGESGAKGTLIPLAWVFEQLSKCKARQKVLILDVCRFDPSRGSDRPGSGPMGEKLDAALKAAPGGVQVWSSCVAGQYSYEDDNTWSVFLSRLFGACSIDPKQRANLGIQRQEDSIPIDALSKTVDAGTESQVTKLFKQKQTPRVTGKEITEGAAPFDSNEPPPPALVIQWKGSALGKKEQALIQAILKDAADVPPVKNVGQGVQPIRVETFPFFSADVLKDYETVPADSPLRQTVINATKVLKKHAQAFQEYFPGNIDTLKKSVPATQQKLATAKLELEETLEAMRAAGKELDKETSKRWQASYDFVLARLLEREAFSFEYNYMLSEIRTDSLPEVDPAKHNGWRLASRDKMQCKGSEGKEAKKHADEAKKILQKLSEEHKGTPWEILAKRESLTALGLEWQPALTK